MRVLHVYRTYFPDTQGGLEEVIRQICKNTISHQVESRVLTLSDDPDPAIIERDEAYVYRYKCTFEVASCGMSFSAIAGFKQLVEWADIIHYHFPWPFADLLHLLSDVKKPSVMTYHSDVVRQKELLWFYRPLMHYFLGRMDRIVATSPNYAATSETLALFRDKVEVIPIGLNMDSYPLLNSQVLELMKARVGDGFFLFIGVLRYYKGLNILLDAIKDSDLKVVIVGSGPVERELHQQAERLGLDNVHFLGRVDDDEKVALIELSRAMVFPSHLRSEAFGVTLLEGAMYGKPLISTEIGTGTSYVNEHNVTGFVVTPNDAQSLRDAMMRLHQDAELAAEMGRAAHKRYEALFTGLMMGERYARLYESVLDTQRLS